MALRILLLIGIHAVFTHGFGFQVVPFQMDVQMPASQFQSPFSPSAFPPGMNMMSFPPVFNPLEAMAREAVDPEARGMDVDSPMGNVTTKNKTESKDGFKVTTITSDGPGFHSYIKEYEKEGNASGNATAGAGPPGGMDLGKLMSSARLFDVMNQLRHMGRKPRKCSKCGANKFCDPIFHLCRKKFAEGRTCMAQKQCGKNLRCQWGKCQKAKKGDPGTFCKGNSQCSGDSCCRNTPGSFHLMCIPQQAEGAICGLHDQSESVAKVFYVVKRSVAPSCSPCHSGLKCADTGNSKYKRCVKELYVPDPFHKEIGSGNGESEDDDLHTGNNKKHTKKQNVLDGAKIKPVKTGKSSATPATPLHPTPPSNPKNPVDEDKPNDDVNGEDGKSDGKNSNYSDDDEDEDEDGSADDDYLNEKKQNVLDGAKIKPVKTGKSSATPATPSRPTSPSNPKRPSDDNHRDNGVNGEDGKNDGKNDNYSDNNEDEDGSADDDDKAKPIPIKTQWNNKANEKKKNKGSDKSSKI